MRASPSEISLIIRHELRGFIKGERSAHIVYLVLLVTWSAVLATNMGELAREPLYLWILFFSVILSGNFGNTVFAAERLNGAMEIVLTCGLARASILYGKIGYVVGMSIVLGALCYMVSFLWLFLMQGQSAWFLYTRSIGTLAMLYATACMMNACSGAWLSFRLANPRLTHFVNLLVMGLIVTVYGGLSVMTPLPWIMLGGVMLVFALGFLLLARGDFFSERVVQPYSP
ncbi:MAG: hypothetical protein ACOC41_08570 [Chitinivibrionales bacterium]